MYEKARGRVTEIYIYNSFYPESTVFGGFVYYKEEAQNEKDRTFASAKSGSNFCNKGLIR
jgi:hypothetical protein